MLTFLLKQIEQKLQLNKNQQKKYQQIFSNCSANSDKFRQWTLTSPFTRVSKCLPRRFVIHINDLEMQFQLFRAPSSSPPHPSFPEKKNETGIPPGEKFRNLILSMKASDKSSHQQYLFYFYLYYKSNMLLSHGIFFFSYSIQYARFVYKVI